MLQWNNISLGLFYKKNTNLNDSQSSSISLKTSITPPPTSTTTTSSMLHSIINTNDSNNNSNNDTKQITKKLNLSNKIPRKEKVLKKLNIFRRNSIDSSISSSPDTTVTYSPQSDDSLTNNATNNSSLFVYSNSDEKQHKIQQPTPISLRESSSSTSTSPPRSRTKQFLDRIFKIKSNETHSNNNDNTNKNSDNNNNFDINHKEENNITNSLNTLESEHNQNTISNLQDREEGLEDSTIEKEKSSQTPSPRISTLKTKSIQILGKQHRVSALAALCRCTT